MYLRAEEFKDSRAYKIKDYLSLNGLLHAARNKTDSKDFMLKIMTAGGLGLNHLRIV